MPGSVSGWVAAPDEIVLILLVLTITSRNTENFIRQLEEKISFSTALLLIRRSTRSPTRWRI